MSKELASHCILVKQHKAKSQKADKEQSVSTPVQTVQAATPSIELPARTAKTVMSSAEAQVSSADEPPLPSAKSAVPSTETPELVTRLLMPASSTEGSNKQAKPLLTKGGFGFVPSTKTTATSKSPKPDSKESPANAGGTRKKNKKKNPVAVKTG